MFNIRLQCVAHILDSAVWEESCLLGSTWMVNLRTTDRKYKQILKWINITKHSWVDIERYRKHLCCKSWSACLFCDPNYALIYGFIICIKHCIFAENIFSWQPTIWKITNLKHGTFIKICDLIKCCKCGLSWQTAGEI